MADSTHETKILINGDSNNAVSALSRVKSAIVSVRESISGITKYLGQLNWAIQAVAAIREGIRKLGDWAHRAETAARNLREELERTSYANAVAHAADSYAKLNSRISETNRLEKERNEILAARKSAERDLEDAGIERKKQLEISALDPNASDYADKKKDIERKYDIMSSDRKAARADEDVRSKSDDLYRAAESKDKEASAIEKELQKHEAVLERAVEQRFKTGMEARGGDEKAVEKAKEAEKAFQEAFDKAKKIREEMEKARAEAQSIRNMAAESLGGNVTARMLNEANKQRIENEAKEKAAEKKKSEETKQKDEAGKLLQRQQNLEDKKLEKQKQVELSGLVLDDPNYDEKKKEIERRYEIKAAENKRDRATNPEDRKAAEEELESISIRQERERAEEKKDKADRYEERIFGQMDSSRPKDRLTAMGLGSGAGADRTAQEQAANVKTLVQLMKEQVTISRQGINSNVSVYSP